MITQSVFLLDGKVLCSFHCILNITKEDNKASGPSVERQIYHVIYLSLNHCTVVLFEWKWGGGAYVKFLLENGGLSESGSLIKLLRYFHCTLKNGVSVLICDLYLLKRKKIKTDNSPTHKITFIYIPTLLMVLLVPNLIINILWSASIWNYQTTWQVTWHIKSILRSNKHTVCIWVWCLYCSIHRGTPRSNIIGITNTIALQTIERWSLLHFFHFGTRKSLRQNVSQ